MNMWNNAYDRLNEIAEDKLEVEHTHLSLDQHIELTKIAALLAIGQELSALRRGDREPGFWDGRGQWNRNSRDWGEPRHPGK